MDLVLTTPVSTFDLSLIHCGDLVWAKHEKWTEGKAGCVTSAKKDQLIVQYHPGIGNVTNHYVIPISEAAAGEWQIRWSTDMEQVNEYGFEED